MASLQSERRIARAEPRLVEVVGLGRQSRASPYQGLGHLVRRRLRTLPGPHDGAVTGAVPPARLGVTIRRIHTSPSPFVGNWTPEQEPYASYAVSGIVGPDATRTLSGGGECDLTTGSFVQYDLPFQLRCSCFSFGVFSCSAEAFRDWTFEAFDGEGWRQLQYCAHSPFPHYPGISTSVNYPPVSFWLPGTADCVSTRFRIRLAENGGAHRCMHIRGLELYGTILPPWRID